MLATFPCFRGETEYLTFQKVLERDIQYPEYFSEITKSLIDSLIKIEPRDRLKLNEIKQHESFRNYDWGNELAYVYNCVNIVFFSDSCNFFKFMPALAKI